MNRYITISFAALLLFVGACKPSEFDDTNVDPNNPSSPNTALLLTSAIRNLGSQTAGITGFEKDLYPQYLSEIQYTNASRYFNRVFDYNPIYNGPLEDLQTIYTLNTSSEKEASYVKIGGSNANQIAIARILKAFYFLHLTDRWGDIPYSEALKGSEVLLPKFDRQKDVYTSLFKELKEAAGQFDGGAISGDILFNGDFENWKSWAISLRMVMALRLSKVDPTTGKAEFTAAMSDGAPILSNDQNAVFRFLADANNQNPYYNNYLSRKDYAVSEPFINQLVSISDPRLPVFANKTTDGNQYKGMPYGLVTGAGYSIRNVSLIGDAFSAQDAPVDITTAAQMNFVLAEAAKLGWISGGDGLASDYYNKGIQASLDEYGVGSSYTAYVGQAAIAYSMNDGLQKIITQKWIAGFMGNGYEAWADYRRTGFPVLSPGPSPQSPDGQIPRRQQYPTTENDLNKANYNTVIQAQGPDLLNTRIYWDKQ